MNEDLFTDEPPPNQSDALFTDEPPPESFLTKTAKNIIPDLGSTAMGLGSTVKQGLYDIPKAILKAPQTVARTGMELSDGVPLADTTLNQERPEWSKNPIETAKAMARPIVHPIDYFSEHPIQQTLNILGIKEGVGAMMGKEPLALPASEAPSALPRAETPPPAEALPPPAAKELPPAPAKATTIPGFDEATKVANEVKNYVSSGYQKYAKKPGSISNLADWAQEKSQMMANQQMGATPLQARQVGHEGMRAIGQYALEKGIVSPSNGVRGMVARNHELLNAAGKTLGDLRKEADALRDPVETPVDVLQQVRSRLDQKYARGAYSGQAGAYENALQDLEDAKPTFEGHAEVATKLNQAANKANRLSQPHQPYTDVANVISEINNERIKALLGPEKAAQYEQGLREYGVNKKISSFLERKAAGEVKRLGPGSLTSNLVQKGMDEIGYKVGAKAVNKLATSVRNNPSLAKDLPTLFKSFINHVDEVGQEVTGLAKGGLVGEPDIDKEIHHHLMKERDPEYARLFQTF